ncbi:laccase-3-like [Rutidosis leptorrhynchoides]|uniref:laccase-3-like n=1 Tax=Rutidosis leptorrhynchoides TaxID=125765 RepID=UPI003A9A1AD2
MSNSRVLFLTLFLSLALTTFAEIHNYEFKVLEQAANRLCKNHRIVNVNGQFPGPTLDVRDGDTVAVKVTNACKFNVTIHWHGVRNLRNPWADGPEMVTQCPIQTGGTYTYRITIQGQEGTLWWHAHSKWLRATVYGALIIRPKAGSSYPFPTPKVEFPVILGEWWDRRVISVLRQALFSGAAPNISDAITINGQPGDLFRCSTQGTTKLTVNQGDTVLLRVINAALNQQLFFSVANHKLTVVATDAVYTKQFTTNVIMLGPGQTTDVLLTADQQPGRYYMAARAYATAQNAPFDNTTGTAILQYKSATSQPILPQLPFYNDTNTVTVFSNQIKSPGEVSVPKKVDDSLFFAVGLGFFNCTPGPRCQGPNNTRFAASMNNVSFILPKKTSILQAYAQNIPNIYTTDFPPVPPVQFDYTGNVPRGLWQPVKGTKLTKLKFGSNVQIILQDTSIFSTEDHPVHIHGYNFYIVGQGFGNFNPSRDTPNFNLVDPPKRNTIDVPVGGWAAIRFVADNPGIWFMHCHIDTHLVWGFATAFLVENGVGELETLLPPPFDLPQC